eukprot:766154-Hanusia_phi.AAC.2
MLQSPTFRRLDFEDSAEENEHRSFRSSDITSASRSHLRNAVDVKHSPYTSMFLGRQAARNEDALRQKAKVLLFYKMLERRAEAEIQPGKDLSFVHEWLRTSEREEERSASGEFIDEHPMLSLQYDGEAASASLKCAHLFALEIHI